MNEMMHYSQCLLNKGTYKGKQILKPETIEKLWKPQIKSPYGYGTNKNYCLGFVLDKGYFDKYTLIHHGGGMGTSCAFFGFIPELNIAVAVAQNSCTGTVSVYGRIAIALLLNINVQSQIKYLEYNNLIDEVSGTYKSPLNLYGFTIGIKNGIIYIDYDLDYGKFVEPVIICNVRRMEFKIC